MKKRVFVLSIAIAMSMAVLAGCGTSKADYKEDMDAFLKLDEVEFKDAGNMSDFVDAIDDLDVKTEEGENLKKDLKDFMELTGDLLEDTSELLQMEEDELEKIQKKLDDLQDKVEKDVEEFQDAAEKAGLDEEEVSELPDIIGL